MVPCGTKLVIYNHQLNSCTYLRHSEEVPWLWFARINIVRVVRRWDAIAKVRRRAVVDLLYATHIIFTQLYVLCTPVMVTCAT